MPAGHAMTSRDTVLSIDCGGTHTDAVCVRAGRVEAQAKVATRHDNLPLSISEVLDEIAAQLGQNALSLVQRITLGTTLLVNAAVQGRLDPVGLILSAGPGLNPERFAGEVVKRAAPSAFVTLGHRLGGELNFPRRMATAYYNSAAFRLHRDFLDAVSEVLAQKGCRADIYLLKADGGAIPLSAARPCPVQSMLSGPAASVMGALALDDHIGDKTTLLLDMGGTTTDLAFFVCGSPVLDRDGMKVEGRRTLIRSLATRSIGIGGDSLLHVEKGDSGPVLETGPVREGRALAFGGARATLLDALNVLNSKDGMDEVAGNVAASQKGLAELGAILGVDAVHAAEMAVDNAMAKICAAIEGMTEDINSRPIYTLRELKEYSDVRPERVCLVGGPSPCVQNRLSQALNLDVTTLPLADVANAVGAALTRPSAIIQVFAHTGKRNLIVPELDVTESLPSHASLPYVEERALALLKDNLARNGIMNYPIQVTQSELFAVLADNGASAKDMRVTAQVVPGLATRLVRS